MTTNLEQNSLPDDLKPRVAPNIEKTTSQLLSKHKSIRRKFDELYPIVVLGNKVSRNSVCKCGSKRKWKTCCLKIHEQNKIKLNNYVLELRLVGIKIRKNRKEKVI